MRKCQEEHGKELTLQRAQRETVGMERSNNRKGKLLKWAHLQMGNIPSLQSHHHELWWHQRHFPKAYLTPSLHGWAPTLVVEATLCELSELVPWEVLPWERPSQMTPSDHSQQDPSTTGIAPIRFQSPLPLSTPFILLIMTGVNRSLELKQHPRTQQ